MPIEFHSAFLPRFFTSSCTSSKELNILRAFTSFGHELDPSPQKFGELRESNDILENAAALRQIMVEDGCLFLRDVLDKEVVMVARREILEKLASIEEIDTTNQPLIEGIASGQSERRRIDIKQFNK